MSLPFDAETSAGAFVAFAAVLADLTKLQDSFAEVRRERDQYLSERNDARDEVNALKASVTETKTGLSCWPSLTCG